MGHRELQLVVAAQHEDRAPYHMEKNENSTCEVWFLLNARCLHTIIKSKNIVSQGLSVQIRKNQTKSS
jgi:hypothetical protein